MGVHTRSKASIRSNSHRFQPPLTSEPAVHTAKEEDQKFTGFSVSMVSTQGENSIYFDGFIDFISATVGRVNMLIVTQENSLRK